MENIIRNDRYILDKKILIFKEKYMKFKKLNIVDEISLRGCICDVLSWIEMCVKTTKDMSVEEKRKISAIRYANNYKKHGIKLYNFNKNVYGLYPSEKLVPRPNLCPSDFNIYWNFLSFLKKSEKTQYNNYRTFLENKNIYDTIIDIYEIIQKYYKLT